MILGIDLGFSGALACVDGAGKVVWVEDMPTDVICVGKRRRQCYNYDRVTLLLHKGWDLIDCNDMTVVCEDIYHMGFRGSLAARAAGIGWGIVRGWCADHEVPMISVIPSQWKRVMLSGRAKGKAAARARAAELFPGVDLGKTKDEGRAEALLLAAYGLRLHGTP